MLQPDHLLRGLGEKAMDLYWLATTVVAGWFGLWLARQFKLEPIAGLILGVALNLLMGTNLLIHLESWAAVGSAEMKLLSGYFLVLIFISFLLFSGRKQAWPILKLTGILTLVAVVFMAVPKYGINKYFSAGSNTSLRLPLEGLSELSGDLVSKLGELGTTYRVVARAGEATPLYQREEGNWFKSSAQIPEGGWFLTKSETVEQDGVEWVEVLLPTEKGEFDSDRSPVGYVPRSKVDPRFRIPRQ